LVGDLVAAPEAVRRLLFAAVEVAGFLVPAFPAHLAHRLCVLGAYAALHVAGMTRRYVVWKRAVLRLEL
jgi:hypothetical protein